MVPSRVVQYGVRFIAAVYVVIGLVGLLPVDALNPAHHDGGFGVRYLLHLVAINAPHDIFHLVIGASGLWAVRTAAGAHRWGVIAGTVLLALCFAGMVQAAAEGFPRGQLLIGLIPLTRRGTCCMRSAAGPRSTSGWLEDGADLSRGLPLASELRDASANPGFARPSPTRLSHPG
jgi:hypothetical protein